MPIIVPSKFQKIDSREYELLESIDEQLLKKIVLNINFLSNLLPIGTIIFVNVNQFGFQPLDASVWQFCNGSEITHPLSPLRSIGFNHNYTPNINERYVKCANSVSDANTMAGTFVWNLAHSHGGQTGLRDHLNYGYDEDGDKRFSGSHFHYLGSALNDQTIDYPKYVKLAPYMKIR
jgi:hypothetical protein